MMMMMILGSGRRFGIKDFATATSPLQNWKQLFFIAWHGIPVANSPLVRTQLLSLFLGAAESRFNIDMHLIPSVLIIINSECP